jgi:predicted negative regulator of RcsB-dependent stress response
VRTSERHQLKQDRFAETTKETISWAMEHRSTLVLSVLVAAIVVAAVGGSFWYWNYRGAAANEALGKAMQTYEAPLRQANLPASPEVKTFNSAQERAKAAHAEFQKVAEQYNHTSAGKVALYMAAMTALDAGDSKGGEQELQQAADSGDKDVAALAKLALAGLYRDSNRAKDAIPLYKDLIAGNSPSVPKVSAQLELAGIYQSIGQPNEAGKLYQEIIKDSPQSPAAMAANQKLADMTK